jgi:hypothetical protein
MANPRCLGISGGVSAAAGTSGGEKGADGLDIDGGCDIIIEVNMIVILKFARKR